MVRRKQVVINFRVLKEPYFISVRAVTLNPNVPINTLSTIAIETAIDVEKQFLGTVKQKKMGFEEKDIDRKEEKLMNNNDVFVQIQERRRVTVFRRVKV